MKFIASAALAVATAGVSIPAGAAGVRETGLQSSVAIAPTATHAFPALRGTRDLGMVSSTMPMHVTLGLAARNTALLDQLIKRQMTVGDPMYQRFLTPAQTAAAFSPTGASVQATAAFLQQRGFRNISVTPDNMIVSADGNAAIAGAAFGTEIHALANNGARIFANTTPARVPVALSGVVTSILGLNNYTLHPAIRLAPAKMQAALRARRTLAAKTSVAQPCQEPVGTLCVLNSYSATGFQTAYDSPPFNGNSNLWGDTGKNTTIAIFTEGDMSAVLTDLVKYENANVPVLPHVSVKVINAGIASPDVSGQDEWDLDSQTSTGMAGNVKALYMYVATSLTDSDTAVDFDRFKTDDIAKAGSASFGECELFPMLDGAEVLEDKIFAEAAVQGQTVFSSAGDNGTTCPVAASTGVPGTGLPAQSYPGVSPYVVSVGGTTLITTVGTGAYSSEIAWYSTGRRPEPHGDGAVLASGRGQSGCDDGRIQRSPRRRDGRRSEHGREHLRGRSLDGRRRHEPFLAAQPRRVVASRNAACEQTRFRRTAVLQRVREVHDVQRHALVLHAARASGRGADATDRRIPRRIHRHERYADVTGLRYDDGPRDVRHQQTIHGLAHLVLISIARERDAAIELRFGRGFLRSAARVEKCDRRVVARRRIRCEIRAHQRVGLIEQRELFERFPREPAKERDVLALHVREERVRATRVRRRDRAIHESAAEAVHVAIFGFDREPRPEPEPGLVLRNPNRADDAMRHAHHVIDGDDRQRALVGRVAIVAGNEQPLFGAEDAPPQTGSARRAPTVRPRV